MYWNPPKPDSTLARKLRLKIRNSPPYSRFTFQFSAISVHLASNQENGNVTFVPDLGDGGAMDDIGNQSMSMCGHGDQIAMFGFRSFQDGACRLAAFMARRDVQIFAMEFRANLLQIFPVFSYFLGIGEVQVF